MTNDKGRITNDNGIVKINSEVSGAESALRARFTFRRSSLRLEF
ncbi:MAG: hypothetical protein SW833_11480 [Cyanobacteriota bacterium]|nr:hypothetical protein [Cyanobacteriota bacterium]